MEQCEKRAFQLLKMRKKKISWNLKTKYVTDFLLTGLRVWRFYFSLRGEHIKDNMYINFNKNNENLKIFFTNKRLFKHKDVVPNLQVSSNCIGKMLPFTFHFSTSILTSSHTKIFNIFFALYMSQCPTINIQFSIMSKWLAKHISTKVSFKISTRKRRVYVDIGWSTIWNQCFYFEFEMMIVQEWYFCLHFSSLHD